MKVQDNRPSSAGTDDLCFLAEKEQPWSEVLADILKQSDIPFYKKGNMGAGLSLKVGPLSERFQFYVPQSYLQKAQALANEPFSEK